MSAAITKELIIIGGGPAGLRSGAEASAAGIDYLILEAGQAGEAWRRVRPDMPLLSPSHPQRDWTSLSPSFPIWKLIPRRPYCQAHEFVMYLQAYSDHFALRLATNQPVQSVTRNENVYTVQTASGQTYEAPLLLIATGIFGNPFIPEIPGAADNSHVLHSHHYRSAQDFLKQRVLVVGAGNSAAEIAIELAGYSMVYLVSRDELQFFADTKKLYHIRGISESYLKELINMEIIRYQAYQQISHIEQGHVFFSNRDMNFDKIIFATGYHGNLGVLKNFKLRVNKKNFPEISFSGESTQYPGLFFCGPLAYQSSSSIVIHGFLRGLAETVKQIALKLRDV
jgi:putative flavoprotein involved in K+ transport